MTEEVSTYYPPRARWYSVFFYLGNAVRRRLALDRLTLPREMKASEMAAGFLVPGLAVLLRGPRLWGQAALTAWAGLFLFYIVWLGYPAANIAFGLMISVHASGWAYYCKPLMAQEPFRARIAFSLLTLIGIMLMLYLPARSLIQQHWLTPMRLNGHVIVVQRIFQPRTVQRGDWVAYTLEESEQGEAHNGGAVWFHGGVGLGPVLAVMGDHVVFSTNGFYINGNFQTNRPHMPASGELTVPEKHWFIWPNLGISGHGNVSEASISATMLSLADVPEKQFLGKPFHCWFWRKQTLP